MVPFARQRRRHCAERCPPGARAGQSHMAVLVRNDGTAGSTLPPDRSRINPTSIGREGWSLRLRRAAITLPPYAIALSGEGGIDLPVGAEGRSARATSQASKPLV